jgi:uncharacterized protein
VSSNSRFGRRRFLGLSAAAGAAVLAPASLDLVLASIVHGATRSARGYGPLVPDPKQLLDLPAGFSYRAFSTAMYGAPNHERFGMKLTNGDPVPPLHDGMAAFRIKRGITALVRNHEIDVGMSEPVDPLRMRPYDPLGTGGTTTLWINEQDELLNSFASLSGTFRNCAGGATPWDTWLTAEECTYLPGPEDPVNHDLTPNVQKRHGYVFEVDARAEELVDPIPIVAMGRFYHEALCIDPKSGFVYLSEDRDDGLLYRFRPDVILADVKGPLEMTAGDLAKGGVLEALRIVERPSARTQNWAEDLAVATPADSVFARCQTRATENTKLFGSMPSSEHVAVGRPFKVAWVRIPNIDPDMDMERDPDDPLRSPEVAAAEAAEPGRRGNLYERTAATSTRAQGQKLGAAQFARGEGMHFDSTKRAVYLCCTNGGPARAGQVWRLDVVKNELTLVVEPNDRALLDGPDNLCVAPNGDVIVAEDGCDEDRLVGLTSKGTLYPLARNAINRSELAGVCFGPDGETMFVNLQNPGITFAIRGPWNSRRT